MAEAGDIKYMRRCLELACKAEGLTYPNPMVGSVIVHDGLIIGEGYHLRSGGPHAEVIAINSVSDRQKLKESTLYVSLEPCSHFGKTPPCSDYIISCSIPRVVIGTTDSNEKVSGRGITKLQEAGCEVKVGVLGEECRWLNRRFFTYHEKKRPYIILKWARSADGYIDLIRTAEMKAEPNWITGKAERCLVHKWRSEEQSILAGGNTVRTDDPGLNVRFWAGRNPLRIILSGSGNISSEAAVFNEEEKILLFTENAGLKLPGADTVLISSGLPAGMQITAHLYKEGIQSLFIEGGAAVLNHFISNDLWDEARIFTGDQLFRNGVKAPEIAGTVKEKIRFGQSSLEILINEKPA
jgi:diaminohydroxyphosphoribosylaminopyrimidine deaminase / 5-amino-6-(5-phosphoribosylamino)uracil reductase